MFELFAALFGGGYLATKISKDKRNKIQAQSESAIRNAIINMLTNYQLEEKLERSLFYVDKLNSEISFNSFNESVKEIYAYRKYAIEQCIPEEDLIFIFGLQWREVLKIPECDIADNAMNIMKDIIPIGYSNEFGNVWGIVLDLLLSIDGIVASKHIINGYQVGREIIGVPFDERVEIAKKACKVIERNIQRKNGKNDDFGLFVTSQDSNNLNWGFVVPTEIRKILW